jgi:predicted ATPase
MAMLERVMLKGFKSIRQMDLELRWLNVMIVANGAGKSNLISFFQLLNEMIGGRLQIFVATAGRAHSLFFYGPRTTTRIQARLEFKEDSRRRSVYGFTLSHAAGDALFIRDERIGPSSDSWTIEPVQNSFGAGYAESRIRDGVDPGWDEAFIIQTYTNYFRLFRLSSG